MCQYHNCCTERREDRLEMMESSSHTYTRGSLVGSNKEWYHGELTIDEAEQALKASGCDCFLIRHCQGGLILSLINDQKIDHSKIDYGPGWYQLHGEHQKFSMLQELIDHYCHNPMSDEVTLGAACGKMKEHDTG